MQPVIFFDQSSNLPIPACLSVTFNDCRLSWNCQFIDKPPQFYRLNASLVGCNILYNTTSLVWRFPLNNSPFFSSTDESLCPNVTNKFINNAQFFHFFVMMRLRSYEQQFTVAFLPLDKNQKSKFQKPWFCMFLTKQLIFVYISTFLQDVLETLAY